MKKRNLTRNTKAKYERIVDEWFVTKPKNFNGAQAYMKFYPSVKKETTATVNFSRIQALPEMEAYIKAKHEEVSRIIKTTHEGILKELQNWLELDVTETIGLSQEEIKLLPIEIRRAITKHKSRCKHFYDANGNLLHTEETIELHFVSKERVAEMINKHIGFYKVDNEQKASEIHVHTSNEKHKGIVQDILDGKI